jgi:ADP-dependent phosphofructokinase/glucokinase
MAIELSLIDGFQLQTDSIKSIETYKKYQRTSFSKIYSRVKETNIKTNLELNVMHETSLFT